MTRRAGGRVRGISGAGHLDHLGSDLTLRRWIDDWYQESRGPVGAPHGPQTTAV